MAIIGYARVSTTGQDLRAQLEALSSCDKIFQEKASASTSLRPELQNLLGYVREGDMVIVTKLDRIARNTADLLNIVALMEEKKVAFKVLNINLDTSTPTGRLMLTMLGAIAQFERELLLERQKEGIEIAKREGKYTGRKPTAKAKSQEVHSLLSQGMTKQAVADKLNIGVASVYRITKGAT
jgi:DNA invertase Pin-like site-specific DNA recombinase